MPLSEVTIYWQMLTLPNKSLTGGSRSDDCLVLKKVRLLGARAHVSHVQLHVDTRLPLFLCVTLKNWEEPGDEASIIHCCELFQQAETELT